MQQHSDRPRIGITMRLELETNRFYLGRGYSEAVEAAGGAPVHIPLIPRREYIAAVLENLDGVLLPGSDSDVDPARYGAEPHYNLGSVQTLKDLTDALVLEEVEQRQLPLLAICFGMQILNVTRGGTLIQDIQTELPQAIQHQQRGPRERHSHKVRLQEGSLLHGLADAQEMLVNSHHHQAISQVGRNLSAAAWTSDGLIEALEETSEGRFTLAVQWHPEIGWEDDKFSQSIFERFVAAASAYAETSKQATYSTRA